jgi:hypothetical protein
MAEEDWLVVWTKDDWDGGAKAVTECTRQDSKTRLEQEAFMVG